MVTRSDRARLPQTKTFRSKVGVMRPSSHQPHCPEKCCGNCLFSGIVFGDLLCFHGDSFVRDEFCGVSAVNGSDFRSMDSSEFVKIHNERAVDGHDLCSEWIHEKQSDRESPVHDSGERRPGLEQLEVEPNLSQGPGGDR